MPWRPVPSHCSTQPQVWGVVDLYGMAVKVTIVDRDERDEQNLITRRALALRISSEPAEPSQPRWTGQLGSNTVDLRVS